MKNTTGPNPLSDSPPGHREVRSFVLREGRLTKAQARALEMLWPRYGIENDTSPIDPQSLFGRSAALHLEIGFGNGDALRYAASQSQDHDFIGIEVHRPGIGSLMIQLEEDGLDNVRLICADAVQALDRFADGTLASVRLYFPDPWPKKRHHKRRIVRAEFVQAIRSKLATGGFFHMATDWVPYAEHMLEVMTGQPGWRNLAEEAVFMDRPAWRPETRFERRGQKLGHEVRDLIFVKTAA